MGWSGTTSLTHTGYHTGQRVLPWFLLFSVALHALLLAQSNLLPQLPSSPAASPTMLRITLLPVAVVAEQTAAVSLAQREGVPTTRTARPAPAVDAVPLTDSARRQLPATAHEAGGERSSSVRSAQAEAESATVQPLASRVGLELARYFYYPLIAQRRGLQGTVLLGFRLTSAGDIEAIHVAQSSGHALLDRAAVGALSKVQRVMLQDSPLPQAIELQLPVIYRLENS